MRSLQEASLSHQSVCRGGPLPPRCTWKPSAKGTGPPRFPGWCRPLIVGSQITGGLAGTTGGGRGGYGGDGLASHDQPFSCHCSRVGVEPVEGDIGGGHGVFEQKG